MPFRSVGATREGRGAPDRTFPFARVLSRVFACVTVVMAMLVGGAVRGAVSVDSAAPTDSALSIDSADPVDAGLSLDAVDAGPRARAVDAGAFPGVDAVGVGAVEHDHLVGVHGPDGGVVRGTSSENQSIVTARRMPAETPLEDIAAAASVLTPADSPRAFDDLGALLLEVPGANVTRRGGFGSFATVSLRGSNPDEVRIYIDGIPLNQAVGGAVDLSTLPLGDVERVEIYRGSTPIAFGESALGGVVSISTHTPGRTRATARAGGGSFRTMFADVTAGGGVGRLKLYAGLHAFRAVGNFPQTAPNVVGGYQPGTRENNDLNQGDGVVRAVLSLPGRRELRAGGIGIMRDQGLPTQAIFQSRVARATTARLLLHLGYESRDDLGRSSRLRAAVFASAMREKFFDPQSEIVNIPTATDDLARSLGATITAEKAVGGWGRLTGLLEGRVEEYLPRNVYDPVMPAGYPATRRVGAAGFELDVRWPWLKLDLLPSARLETSRDVRTGRDSAFAHRPAGEPVNRLLPVLRLGLLRSLGDGASLRANVGRYGRNPSFVELYGYNSGVVGNSALRPERGWNADMGATVSRQRPGGKLVVSATLFGAEVEDLISWRTYSGQARAENTSRARIWGVETELRLRLRRLSMTAQATLTDARDQGDVASSAGRQIAYHPRYRGYARAEWRQPVVGFTVAGYADCEGSAGAFHTPSRYGALPARLLPGAGLALEHERTGLRLSISAFNLADTRTMDFPGYPLPGRSVFASLGWSRGDSRSHNPQE